MYIIGISISIKYVGNKFHKNNVIGLILKKERVRTLSDSVAEPEPEEPKLFQDLEPEPEPEPKINFNKHFLQSFVGCQNEEKVIATSALLNGFVVNREEILSYIYIYPSTRTPTNM